MSVETKAPAAAPAAAAAPATKAAATSDVVIIPKFKTIGTGSVTIGGTIFKDSFVPVEDVKLAARLRKLNTMFVEYKPELEQAE